MKNMNMFNPRNNNGFSLIEVLATMIVLTIGLLGTAVLIAGIINANALSNRISTATVLAQDKMEEIKRVGFHGAVAKAGIEDYNTILNHPFYRRITGVVAYGTPITDMKTVTVTVYWDSNTRSVELKTLLTR